MSHNINCDLSLQCIGSFSLLKEEKSKIFGFYKTARSTKKNYQNKINSLLSIIPRNDLAISKEISFNYILSMKKNIDFNNFFNFSLNNTNFNNRTSSSYEKVTKNKNQIFKDFKNENELFKRANYCKNKKVNNKNKLIKPIIIEDTVLNSSFNFPNSKKINNKNNLISNYPKNTYKDNLNTTFNIKDIQNLALEVKNVEIFPKELKMPVFLDEVNYSNKKNKILDIKNNYQNYQEVSNKTNINESNQKINNSFKEIRKENDLLLKEKPYFSSGSLTIQESSDNLGNNNGTIIVKSKTNIFKGRKRKNSQYLNIESKHTKHSSDNMMRKIKNKVIESMRLLINKVLKDEIKNENIKYNLLYKEFRKIQGSFSQELNVKYNYWFYQITIKDIFCLEISNKYTAIEKSSNKELIDYIYSPKNNNKFPMTKNLLNTSFHQFYHDIFLGEEKTWKNYYGVSDEENIYGIEYLLNNLEEEDKGEFGAENKKYVNDINDLAHHYEEFFLEKKPRNVDYNNKKNQFIKTFMQNTLNDEYLTLLEEVKKHKNYYDARKGQKVKFTKINVLNQAKEETMNNNLINESTQIELNEVKTKNNSALNLFEVPSNETIKNSNTNESIINLEENKEKESNIENISENVLSKKESNSIVNIKEDDLEKNEDKILCNNKRKNDKIKYFIFYKKLKTEDNSKDLLLIK